MDHNQNLNSRSNCLAVLGEQWNVCCECFWEYRTAKYRESTKSEISGWSLQVILVIIHDASATRDRPDHNKCGNAAWLVRNIVMVKQIYKLVSNNYSGHINHCSCCRWPGANLAPEHLQLSWWRRMVGAHSKYPQCNTNFRFYRVNLKDL